MKERERKREGEKERVESSDYHNGMVHCGFAYYGLWTGKTVEFKGPGNEVKERERERGESSVV